MMKQTIFLAALFAVALGSVVREDKEDKSYPPLRDPIDDVDYFDCSGLPANPQLHLHPWDCTRYIHCHNGRAADTPCAPCNETVRCPDGYLHWDGVLIDGNEPSCIWPDQSTCKNGNPPTKPPTSTTTKRSTDDDIVTDPTTTTPNPVGGGECPKNCSQTGYCVDYWECVGKETWDGGNLIWWGKWQNRTCPKDSATGEELWWNPDLTSPVPNPGGQCDKFDNLSIDWQKKYYEDCFEECYWEEHSDQAKVCDGYYHYWNRVNPTDRFVRKEEVQCGPELVFNPDIKTCDFCKNVDPKWNAGKCC